MKNLLPIILMAVVILMGLSDCSNEATPILFDKPKDQREEAINKIMLRRMLSDGENMALDHPGQEIPTGKNLYKAVDFWHVAPVYSYVLVFDGNQVKTIAKEIWGHPVLAVYKVMCLLALALMLFSSALFVFQTNKAKEGAKLVILLATVFAITIGITGIVLASSGFFLSADHFSLVGTSMVGLFFGFCIGGPGGSVLIQKTLDEGKKRYYWRMVVIFYLVITLLFFA